VAPEPTSFDPGRWGIDTGYYDAAGQYHDAPPGTIEALRQAMGTTGPEPPPSTTIIVSPGHERPAVGPGTLVLEDGTERPVEDRLPDDLPFGYHRFDHTRRVVVSPGRAWLPDNLRTWGWAAQLYATRSIRSWGIGDLADLRRLGSWSAGPGAGVTLINPLDAGQQPSPYSASSRCFRDPLYLRIDEIPGADRLEGLDGLAAAGRELNRSRHIDRAAIWRLKSTALETLHANFVGDADFDRFTRNGGATLHGYATFCALAEIHGVPWGKWAPRWQRSDDPDVAAFAASGAGAERVRYHAWLQWLLDRQLHDASLATGLIHDLAIGTDAGGADAWLWQDSLALEARVGAPPDEFNTQGQDWGLPPFDPWRLQAAEYEPFIQVVRAGLRHGAGLRFDHVMGLFRLFWIPEGASPVDGAYVRYPWSDLLDILALESHRAGAFIVGEDLGTVEDFVRHELYERGVLSYRLLWFEPAEPKDWPTQALGAVTTHDLPTIAGLWSGSDLEAQRRIGLEPNEAATESLRARLAEMTGVDDDAPADVVVPAAYRLLADAPCAVLTATLDDALAVEERPNMPGTIDEWPNWSLALPEPLEVLEVSPLAADIANSLQRVPGGNGSPVNGAPGAEGPFDPLVE